MLKQCANHNKTNIMATKLSPYAKADIEEKFVKLR